MTLQVEWPRGVARGAETVCNFQRMEPKKKPRGRRGSAAKEPLPPWLQQLPERVKKARESLGLSQGQIAKAAGITQGKVSELESGNSLAGVRVTTLAGVALALNASLDTLVFGKGDVSAAKDEILGAMVKAIADGDLSRIAVEQSGSAPASEHAPDPAALPAPKSPRKRPRHRS